MSVPASSERFIAKARDLPVDEVMLDLEDSVAPDAKPAARELAVAALQAGGWDGKLVAVRVNGVTTPWAYQDVIAVAEGAPGAVDSLILPKVSDPAAVVWLDVLLGQLERSAGLAPGRIGIEAQIEDAAGLAAVEAIAASSSRLVSLVFGPADFMASIGMRSLTVGGQPEGYAFDAHHYPLMRMLVAAKARGLQAIDGPYAKIGDTEGLRAAGDQQPPRSATTASGCCTRARSTSSTRRSPRRPMTTRGRCASLTPTSRPRRLTGAARSCWTAR